MFFKKEETEEVKNFYEQCQQDFINRTHNAIVSLVEENKLLKEENEILKNGAHFYITPRGYGKTLAEENRNLKIDNEQLKEQLKDEKNYHEEASKWYKEAFDTTQENIKLKSVLKEIREFVLAGRYGEEDDYESISLYIPDLLKIIDKGIK